MTKICLACGEEVRVGVTCVCGFEWEVVGGGGICPGLWYRWNRVGEMKYPFKRVSDGCLLVIGEEVL